MTIKRENTDLDVVYNKAYINGRWVDSETEHTFAVNNPANGSQITEVPDCSKEEAFYAIESAYQAFQLWRELLPLERSNILRAWAMLIRERNEALARLMTMEQGKPLKESRVEIAGCAATLEWCAEQGRRVYGEFIEGPRVGTKIIVSRHPVGVVGAITPWNFPSSMIIRKVGPALAAGCTVVLKPAEATPLSALALAALAEKAGMPAGVFNVITSTHAADIGQAFSEDTRVKKLSFTGSTAVGRTLMRQAAAHVQKISLELGGNAPFIVFPSADLEKAAQGAVVSKFRNAGQTCICANRIFVHKDIFDGFLENLSNKIKGLKVGNGLEEGVDIGPLINVQAIEKIEKMISQAEAGGARILIGGKRHALGGTFFEPTLMIGARDEDLIAQEEIFGPVAVLYPFEGEEDVIRRANDTAYGLSSYIYTSDMAQAWRVSDALAYGMVGVNEPLLATDLAPFGGIKESGMGREGGIYGLLDYTTIKYRLMG